MQYTEEFTPQIGDRVYYKHGFSYKKGIIKAVRKNTALVKGGYSINEEYISSLIFRYPRPWYAIFG